MVGFGGNSTNTLLGDIKRGIVLVPQKDTVPGTSKAALFSVAKEVLLPNLGHLKSYTSMRLAGRQKMTDREPDTST